MSAPYDWAFYLRQSGGSARSAAIVVPQALKLFPVGSVVDVGCGVGTWLEAFIRNGVTDVLGVDGDHVDRALLRIPPAQFRAADLNQPLDLGRSFDLACSLEVAEHLPAAAADPFVAGLVRLAPRVLFSAAVPQQGGVLHLNERPQSWWARRFLEHGYAAFDCIRPQIYDNPDVEWWYQQNILPFCAPDFHPEGFAPVTSAYELDRIHPDLVASVQMRPYGATQALIAIRNGAGILARQGRAAMRRLFARG